MDAPIYWANPDFGDGTFAGSKIAGGWDYFNNVNISNVTNPASSHGTACAGILGALRNNSIGVAGIAGGDVAQGNTGVSLYSFGIFNGNTSAPASAIATAITQASSSTGYGCNLLSNSWGGFLASPLIQSAVKNSWLNKCVFFASRGNNGNTGLNYPATYSDDWVISVGASGTHGKYKDSLNGDNWFASSYGRDMDLIAGGTTQIVTSTQNPSAAFVWQNGCTRSNSNYGCFSGSSSACPHAAGVGALMLSKHNTINGYPNNLAPEDVEFLLQKYSSDVVDSALGYGVGYDQKNGWGLLNAGAVMSMINSPHYQVFHPTADFVSDTLLDDTVQIQIQTPMYGLGNGYYYAKLYRHTEIYNDVFALTTQVLDAGGAAVPHMERRILQSLPTTIAMPNSSLRLTTIRLT